MKKIADAQVIKLLEKLKIVQKEMGLLDCDLASILGITNSYLYNTRKREILSKYLKPKVVSLVKLLTHVKNKHEKPLFEKRLSETTVNFRERKKELVEALKNDFYTLLLKIDNKE